LPLGRLSRVLDVGYGSGIFFPELAHYARSLHGIDVHPNGARVRSELSACGVDVSLARGDGAALPFRNCAFDAVVIVSALEFIENPGLALIEAYRVTRPGGVVLAITPRPHRWADWAYSLLVGFDPETNFNGGRARVQQALETLPVPVRRLARPALLPRSLALYELVVLQRPLITDVPSAVSESPGGVRVPADAKTPASASARAGRVPLSHRQRAQGTIVLAKEDSASSTR
jgi:SAM-dependent methyltransferase